MNEFPKVEVRFTPELKRNLRTLSKKYHHIRSDIQPVIEQIQTGNFVGNRISGTKYAVFKVRIKNNDVPKGKSSGYQLIYEVKTPALVILVTVYSKLDQSDISSEQIRRVLIEFEGKKP